MKLPESKFNKTLISSAIGLALITSSPNVLATVIEANVDYTVGAITSNDNDTSNVEPSAVDVIGGTGDGSSSIFYHTFGDTDGDFGSRVSGDGTFDITGFFQFDNTYTNDTGIDQDFIFDFTIIAGELNNSFGLLDPGDSLFASYDIDVMVDFDQDGSFDSTIFESSASVTTTDAGTTIDTDGSTLDGASPSISPGFARYSWNETMESLFIGTIAAGDSFDLQYILTTTARGVTTSNNNCFGGGEFLAQVAVDNDVGEGSCNSALARNGDPFGPGAGNTFSISSTPTNPLPEPTSLILLGLGATALVAGRRKKSG